MSSQEYFVAVLLGIFFVLIIVIISFATMPGETINQPIEFNHKRHYEYFQGGTHRQTYFNMHEDILDEVPEELAEGYCLDCHGDFDEAAEDIPQIETCAGCHEIFLKHDIRTRPEIRPCIACHRTVPSSETASIPDIMVCMACHQEPRTQNPEEQKLIDYINDAEEIIWVRVYDYLPGDIVFSHERHVMLGKIDCRQCHGSVEEAAKPLKRIMELSMEDCMDCHEITGADNDCLACHR